MEPTNIRDWFTFLFEGYICLILTLEYFYDAAKDAAKKQKRTKTTKKTITSPTGEITTDEVIESVESKEGKEGG